MLGLGAGTIPFQLSKLYPGKLSIDVVEVNCDYVDLTRKFLPPAQNRLQHNNPGWRGFCQEEQRQVDIIIQDAYDRGVHIPEQFLDKTFISAAHGALKDDGILAINFAPDVFYLPLYMRKLRKSFKYVYRSATSTSRITYFCARRSSAKSRSTSRSRRRCGRTKTTDPC